MSDTAVETRSRSRALARFPLARTVGYLSLFCFLTIIITLAIYAVDSRAKLRERMEAEATNSTFYLAEHASRIFEAVNLALDVAVERIGDLGWDEISASKPIWTELRSLNDRFPYIDGIWLNDASGQLRATSFVFPVPVSNVTDRDFFKAHLQQNDGIFVSELIRGRIHDRLTFLLSRRLSGPAGEFRGIVSATVNIDYFVAFYRSMNLPERSIITMFREADLGVVAQQPKSTPEKMQLPHDRDVLRQTMKANPIAATFRSHSPDGEEWLAAYRKIQPLPLFISFSISLGPVEEDWRSDLLESSALAVAALLALAALTWVAFRNAHIEQQFTANLESQVEARTAEINAASAQLSTMFQEVHHRVKNNLQVVTSLLRLQMGRVEDKDLKASLLQSINRVQAMSLVHQLLYSTHEITDVDFSIYLQKLATQFLDAYGASSRIQIDVKGDAARYSLNTAIPLALIINELLSNALKHAYPDERSGRIEITLKRQDGASEMVMCDDGPGFPEDKDWRNSKGLGLQIVRSLAGQIGGQVEMRARAGTCFVVTWPDEAREAE